MTRRIINLSTLFVLTASLMLPVFVTRATVAAAMPQASVITTNTEVPIEFFNVNSCTGETITINGTSHVVFHSTASSGGNTIDKLEINFALQGVGSGGTNYVVNETVSSTTASHENGSFVFNSVSHLNVISQGSTDNLLVKLEWHTTFNSNGELTSSRFDFTVECQG
ncbi:MAG TPA: hypothetical protein VE842_14505 [Pyrinomonadaceae bacterium]|jgi:hypothetical protein|nr:hypothetical protein [Pyrinomonadaceae bacterium]